MRPVADSVLAAADVETERGVILEEIAMHDDEPGDEVHDLFARAVYGDHPLGRLISGTEETVTPMTRRQIQGFYRRRYTAPQIVIAAAGNLDHAAVVKLVRQALARHRRWTPTRPRRRRTGRRPRRYARSRPPRWSSRRTPSRRTSCSAARPSTAPTSGASPSACSTTCSAAACPAGCSRRSGSSAGLAYSVYSYASQYADTGLFAVYAGCAPGKVDEVLRPDPRRAGPGGADGLTEAELARGKGMSKGSFVLGLEDTGSRMSRLAKGELLYGDLMPVDELLARVDAVTAGRRERPRGRAAGPADVAGRGRPVRRPATSPTVADRADRRRGPRVRRASIGIGCAP